MKGFAPHMSMVLLIGKILLLALKMLLISSSRFNQLLPPLETLRE
jgi:hypothetical protein